MTQQLDTWRNGITNTMVEVEFEISGYTQVFDRVYNAIQFSSLF
jgi:hypothetical protein